MSSRYRAPSPDGVAIPPYPQDLSHINRAADAALNRRRPNGVIPIAWDPTSPPVPPKGQFVARAREPRQSRSAPTLKNPDRTTQNHPVQGSRDEGTVVGTVTRARLFLHRGSQLRTIDIPGNTAKCHGRHNEKKPQENLTSNCKNTASGQAPTYLPRQQIEAFMEKPIVVAGTNPRTHGVENDFVRPNAQGPGRTREAPSKRDLVPLPIPPPVLRPAEPRSSQSTPDLRSPRYTQRFEGSSEVANRGPAGSGGTFYHTDSDSDSEDVRRQDASERNENKATRVLGLNRPDGEAGSNRVTRSRWYRKTTKGRSGSNS